MKTILNTEVGLITPTTNGGANLMPVARGLNAAVLAVLFLTIGISANAQLMHRYSFATDASDSVGTANGTLVAGTISSGLTTTGANNTDGVTLPTSAVAGITGPFSLETWFHATAPQGPWHTLFSFSDGTTDNYVIGTPVRGDGGFYSSMAVKFGGTESLCKGNPEDSWGDASDVRQMLLTYDGTTLTYYENGVAATVVNNLTRTGVNLQSIATSSLGINGHSPWGDPSLNGTTRDFRIYNQHLTSAQVALLYARGYGASNASISAALNPPVYSWKGNVNGIWDINTTANWYNSQTAAGDVWSNLDVTLFDDTATTYLVTNTTTVYPVSLTVSNNNASYTFAGNGTISGTPLLKLGGGTLTIKSTNTFTGSPSQIQKGTVVLAAPTTFNSELWNGSTTNSGASLMISNTTVTVSDYFAMSRGGGSGGNTFNLILTNGSLSVAHFSCGYDGGFAGNNAFQNISLLGNSVLIDTGVGNTGFLLGESIGSTATMVLANNSAITNLNTFFDIGNWGTGSLTIKDNASLTAGGDFNVADVSSAQGNLNLQNNSQVTAASVYIGKAAACVGTVTQTGGDFTGNVGGNNEFQIGVSGQGTWTQSGGTNNAAGYVSVGRLVGSVGILSVSGGTFNQTGTGTSLIVGEEGTGILTISGSGVVNSVSTGAGVTLGLTATGVGTLNLNGGTLVANHVLGNLSGSGTFNFNGGTLKAGPSASSTFMSYLSTVNVLTGGAVIDTAGNNISIVNVLNGSGGDGGLVKQGAGTLTLSPYGNNYTGSTVVNGGKLSLTALSATTGGGGYTVANNAELGLTALALNDQINLASLTLGNCTNDFDFGNFSSPAVALENVTGALTVNGVVTINIANIIPTVGVSIPLITYGSKTGTGSFVLGSLPLGVAGNLSTVGNTLQLNITGVNLPRWEGLAGGNWDVGVTTNWIDIGSGNPTKFAQGNAAVFDDQALGTTTVNLVATVNPGSVIVTNNILGYNFSGSGKISGSAGLTKQGPGALTNATASDYTGPTMLQGGTLVATSLANYGSASSLGSSNLVFAGGALAYTGPNVTINRGYTVAGGGTLDLQNNLTLNGAVTATSGNFTKTGLGTLTYGGATTNNHLSAGDGAAAYVVAGGKVVLNGASGQTNKINGETWLGNGIGTTGELDVINGAVLNADNWFVIGVQGATGTLSVTNSTINHTANGDFIVGADNSSSVGVVNLVNSMLNQNVNYESIGTGGANGTLNQIGGTNAVAYRLNVGSQAGSTGSYNLNGGTVSVGNDFGVGVTGATGTMTLSSNAVFNQTGGWSYIGGNFDSPHSGTATLTLKDNSTMTTAGNFYVGLWGAVGILNISNNATLNKNGGGVFDVGDFNGTVNQSGGTNTTGGELWVGDIGTGTYNLSGGVLSINSWFAIGRDNGSGTVNMTGGTITKTGGGNVEIGSFGGNPHSGTFNLSGGVFDIQSGIIAMGIDVAVGTLNLNGGTLKTSQITKQNGTANVNFNGGTLTAKANQASFVAGLSSVTVQTNGAIIDDGGFSIGISQALLGDPAGDGGLTKTGNGTLALSGVNTYTNVTKVNAGTLAGTGTIAGPLTNSATLAPGNGGIGTLTINGNITLSVVSTNLFEVNGTTPANDIIVAGANVTYGGKLMIVPTGTFTAGQQFHLFSGAGATNASNFASIAGSPGAGLGFTFTNGVLSVVSAGPSGSSTLTNSVAGGGTTLSLSWGAGWKLQMQTNSLSKGLGTNWVYLTDGTLTSTNISIDKAKPTVFYRLTYP